MKVYESRDLWNKIWPDIFVPFFFLFLFSLASKLSRPLSFEWQKKIARGLEEFPVREKLKFPAIAIVRCVLQRENGPNGRGGQFDTQHSEGGTSWQRELHVPSHHHARSTCHYSRARAQRWALIFSLAIYWQRTHCQTFSMCTYNEELMYVHISLSDNYYTSYHTV